MNYQMNIDAMRAHERGKPVQKRLLDGGQWRDCPFPTWNMSLYEFRPKPAGAQDLTRLMACRAAVIAAHRQAERLCLKYTASYMAQALDQLDRLIMMQAMENGGMTYVQAEQMLREQNNA